MLIVNFRLSYNFQDSNPLMYFAAPLKILSFCISNFKREFLILACRM